MRCQLMLPKEQIINRKNSPVLTCHQLKENNHYQIRKIKVTAAETDPTRLVADKIIYVVL